MSSTLKEVLDSLVVPSSFSRYDTITDSRTLNDLYTWKTTSLALLANLDVLNIRSLTLTEQARLVRVVAPLTAIAEWSSSDSRRIAAALLLKVTATQSLITHILAHVVKPLFAPSPHPRLHTSTARILTRSADIQDTYQYQPWKDHPGLDEVIRYCLLNIEPSAYESTWPLLLPPLMSFLDDYQVSFKILGVRLVSDMLTRVPPELLIRTGVDALLFTSLTNALNYLRDPSTPELVRVTVRTTLRLIDITTPSSLTSNNTPHTSLASHTLYQVNTKTLATRFTRLSTLLSSSLLGTVIMYTPTILPPNPTNVSTDPLAESGPSTTSDDEDVHSDIPEYSTTQSSTLKQAALRTPNPTLLAVGQTLPDVFTALGIGCARFLKGIIPVLSEWLALPVPIPVRATTSSSDTMVSPSQDPCSPLPWDASAYALHLASLSCLVILMRVCAVRIKRWAPTIVDALARCWVLCLDAHSESRQSLGSNRASSLQEQEDIDKLNLLQTQLRETAIVLADVCPGVIENEYLRLLEFDQGLFGGLVDGIDICPGGHTATGCQAPGRDTTSCKDRADETDQC